MQKTNKSKILSFGWVLDIMKCFKRWGAKYRLELSGDTMKYVIIEDKLVEAPMTRCEILELECYVANINP